MRLIDADALKSEMVADLANTMRMREMHKGDMAVRVLNKIDEALTIDAIPVVRCKDCKASQPCIDDNYVWCSLWHEEMARNGFCHEGMEVKAE